MTHIIFHNCTLDTNDLWYDSHRALISNICIELEQTNMVDKLVEKFLGKKIKIKKIRDPLKPKRPKSSYLFFCQEFRKDISDNLSEQTIVGTKLGTISKELSVKWKSLDLEQKQKYILLHDNDKIRYQNAMKKYKM